MSRSVALVRLCEMTHEQEGDLFALMTSKEELTTRDGKPYLRVGFRDAAREVNFPVWNDSPLAADCRQHWTPGTFYKLRALYRETQYGPQLEICKIREVTEADRAEGFDLAMCLPQSPFDAGQMFDELRELARTQIGGERLRSVVLSILETHREKLLTHPAARRHHHAFVGGLLEHTLSVAKTCAWLAEKYAAKYAQMQPPLDRGLVVAAAILHDIGKLDELQQEPTDASYTPAGALVGHLLLGRDMVRQAAQEAGLDVETCLRLEHAVIAHQRLAEWGSPKPPMTPEALIVHYADDLDAKFDMMAQALRDDRTPGPLTSDKNLLRCRIYRGG